LERVSGQAFMQIRTYFLTTIEAWQAESAQLATSHFVHADSGSPATPETKILAMVEADEGTLNSLSKNPAWLELPHPLNPKLVPEAVAHALTSHGVTPFNTTFEATESIARSHPILRYRVF
jgi:hypothetical protein